MAQREDAVIRIRDLTVQRGEKRVLPGVSLAVRRGIVTGLLGPSGSGKTTLMRSIVGVQIVQSGDVEVLGLPAGTGELRRRIAYVTQAPSVYGDLTVRENLDYFARVLDAPSERIDETIAAVGLEPQQSLRRDLWAQFRSLAAQGKTVLVSTHVMDEADRCDELVLLRDGQIVATGSPAALREQAGTDDLEAAFLALAEGS
jgi:ABC-2 type transport system ATP-binding protein